MKQMTHRAVRATLLTAVILYLSGGWTMATEGETISRHSPHVPVIKLVEAKLQIEDNKVLTVTFRNTGQQEISSGVEFTVNIGGQDLSTVTRAKIGKLEEFDVFFIIPNTVELDHRTKRVLTAKKLDHPIHVWEFKEFPLTFPTSSWEWIQLIFLIISILAAISYLIYSYSPSRHSLVRQLTASPETLFHRPPRELSIARHLLKRAGRLEAVLAEASVSKNRLDQAIDFDSEWQPERQCRYFAQRIGAAFESVQAREISMFKLSMGDDFLLNMEYCYALFPPYDIPAQDVINQISTVQGAKYQVCLIITTHESQQRDMRSISSSADNLLVTPNSKELTTILLCPSPLDAFTRLITSQIQVAHISPYQPSGGVDRESVFFGRQRLLSRIMQRDPANYILVGGRQQGKSSLLKALKRRYKNRPGITCLYLVLSGAGISASLARVLKLPLDTSAADIFAHIRARTEPLLFLIDEADAFIREEAGRGFETLHHFRALSEEGFCYFILAGFWNLFHAAALDYHSPIKNFGETLMVEELEPEACRDLAARPMAMLNIHYESDELVDILVQESGGRANLIAIICNEMLKKPDLTHRTLDRQDLKRALDGEEVRTALSGWEMMTEDQEANRLDRIIVYAAIREETFTTAQLLTMLKNLGARVDAEQVKRSLSRLRLAFILKRRGENYTWCVPLFTKMIRQSTPGELLASELRE